MTTNAYNVVDQFEKRVAEFAGSKYAVAVDSGTSAIKLSLQCMGMHDRICKIPTRTYISVPMAIIQSGNKVFFDSEKWKGMYRIRTPLYDIVDGAKCFRRDMFFGISYHCLSFHAKKHINIGRGGMILTDNEKHYDYLKLIRYDGRQQLPYGTSPIEYLGYNAYMTPEQAARGMMLMDVMPKDGFEDQVEDYPDLTDEKLFPVFKDHPQVVRG